MQKTVLCEGDRLSSHFTNYNIIYHIFILGGPYHRNFTPNGSWAFIYSLFNFNLISSKFELNIMSIKRNAAYVFFYCIFGLQEELCMRNLLN